MAKVIVSVCDRDHDESTPAEAFTVSLDGAQYEIDLCDEHRQELDYLRGMLEEYISAGRRVEEGDEPAPAAPPAARATSRRRTRQLSTPERQENAGIREWARTHGIELAERGRIPDRIKEQYREWVAAGRPETGSYEAPVDERPSPERVLSHIGHQITQGRERLAAGGTPHRGNDGVVRWTSG